jgi:thiamine biosynthesis lipoprotein
LPLLGCALLLLAAAQAQAATGFRTRMRLQMGSLTEITVPAGQYGAEAVDRAFGVIERLDALLSTYKPDSEVMRLARAGKLAVSPEFLDLALRSLEWSERSGGAFDPLLSPLLMLWREAVREQAVPAPEAIEAARRKSGPARIHIDRASGTIAFAEPGMGFDFGAIGKGYAMDLAGESLRRDGITVALLASGGSSHRLLGLPAPQDCWELGIRHPEDPERAVALLRMGEGGLATSAQTGQPLEIAGRRFGHILDPRTGSPAEPPDPVWSASVLGPEATGADALSTAVVVMGAARGLALIESLPGYEALLVLREPGGTPSFRATRGLRQAGMLEGLPLFVPEAVPDCFTRSAGGRAPGGPALTLNRPPGALARAPGGPSPDEIPR